MTKNQLHGALTALSEEGKIDRISSKIQGRYSQYALKEFEGQPLEGYLIEVQNIK